MEGNGNFIKKPFPKENIAAGRNFNVSWLIQTGSSPELRQALLQGLFLMRIT